MPKGAGAPVVSDLVHDLSTGTRQGIMAGLQVAVPKGRRFNPWRQTKKFRKMSPRKTMSTSRFRIHSQSEGDSASPRKATSNGVMAAVKSSATAVTSDRARGQNGVSSQVGGSQV